MSSILHLILKLTVVKAYWERILELGGEMLRIPDMSDLVDLQAADQVAQMMMQMGISPGGSGASPPRPRFARDIGPPLHGRGGQSAQQAPQPSPGGGAGAAQTPAMAGV